MVLVLANASVIYKCDEKDLGAIENASIVFDDNNEGRVAFVGPADQVPKDLAANAQVIDVSGKIVMPGLVDCHTHTVWAGSRAEEFQQRLAGASYVSILEKGGGILSTVRETRKASKETLVNNARQRVLEMRDKHGVTTVEIKSGYGLTPQDELKMLQAAKECKDICRIFTTFLGAHTFPAEFRENEETKEKYVEQVINEQIPICAKHADFVDIFCDRGAFNLEQAERILTAGGKHDLKIRAHAEQIMFTGCAKLVAKLGGLSADHLEQLDEEGASAMAEKNVVAVLLPGAQFYLKDTSPPVQLLRRHGVKMAVATDLNPGSSPVHDIWTTATMSCILQGLTVQEAVLGITKHAALALGQNDIGWLGVGSAGDAIVLNAPAGEPARIESLIQHMGTERVAHVIVNGKLVK